MPLELPNSLSWLSLPSLAPGSAGGSARNRSLATLDRGAPTSRVYGCQTVRRAVFVARRVSIRAAGLRSREKKGLLVNTARAGPRTRPEREPLASRLLRERLRARSLTTHAYLPIFRRCHRFFFPPPLPPFTRSRGLALTPCFYAVFFVAEAAKEQGTLFTAFCPTAPGPRAAVLFTYARKLSVRIVRGRSQLRGTEVYE